MVGWLKHCAYDQHGMVNDHHYDQHPLVQNPLVPFCPVLGKDTLWHFLLLGILASISKLKSYLYILQVDSNILSSLEADWVIPYPMH